MTKLLLIAIAISTLAACQHTVLLPGSLRQRPDTAAESFGGNVAFGVRQPAGITVFEDLGTTPPTRPTNPEAELSGIVPLPYVDVELGLLSSLDVYFNTGFGVKWLFLGTPREEGWRAAIFGGLPNDPWDSTADKHEDCDLNCEEADTKFKGVEYGLTVGKQLTPAFMVYLTGGVQKGKAETIIKQTGGTEYTYEDGFEHSVATIGMVAGTKWHFIGEFGYHHTKWTKEEGGTFALDGYSYNLGAGFRW